MLDKMPKKRTKNIEPVVVPSVAPSVLTPVGELIPQPETEYLPSPTEAEVAAASPFPTKLALPNKDTLLGSPVIGYEGKYWHVLENDPTLVGYFISGNNLRVPKTMHIPTGSKMSYIKVWVYLKGGAKLAVWEKYQDLTQL